MASPFKKVVDRLDLESALTKGAQSNDLLPPRPEDQVGGEVGKRFSEALRRDLERESYDPTPAYIVNVPKSTSATRPAALLTLADRVVYEALVQTLRPRIESSLLGNGILFWPRGQSSSKRWHEFEHSPIAASDAYVVIADLSAFYESIDHEGLAERLVRATGRKDETDALFAFLTRVMASRRGLPQGLEPSDTLATAYLSPVDSAMVRDGFRYWRHGDDLRIATSDYDTARRAILTLESRMREIGLFLNGNKTKILKRATYERELLSIDETLAETRNRLMQLKTSALESDPDALSAAIDAAEREQLGWDFFYHGKLSLHEVIEELRPHLEPDDAEVAEQLFRDTVRRLPGLRGGLPADAFHQRLVASLIRLAAARSDAALGHVGRLLVMFPDKTELLCSYLSSLASTAPERIARQAGKVFANGRFRTEWETAWVIRALTRVHERVIGSLLSEITGLISAPHGQWLAAVEAAKLLAARHELDHASLSQLWNACPRAFRVDLVVAAEAMCSAYTWAEAFLLAAQDDPIHRVVSRQLQNRRAQD